MGLAPPHASVSSMVKQGGWLGRVPQELRAGPMGMSKAEVSLLIQEAFGVLDGKLPAGLSFVYSLIECLVCAGGV